MLGVDDRRLTDALLAALRFRAYPDAAPALRELRALGLRLVVVSNWDASLHERLHETGLAPLVDGAVASAELGHAKPDRAIFEHALELAGRRAGGGAARRRLARRRRRRRAGRRAAGGARRARRRAGARPRACRSSRSLAELPALCRYP